MLNQVGDLDLGVIRGRLEGSDDPAQLRADGLTLLRQLETVTAPFPSLTGRQLDCARFIQGYIDEKGRGPSYVEIAVGIRLSTKSGVHRLVSGLRERGILRTAPGVRARSLQLVRRVPDAVTP